MKIRLLNLLMLCGALLMSHPVARAQSFERIADKTVGYVKAGTFGKPDVAKKTGKLALAHVRVHYKFVTTSAVETRTSGAKVSVYLDGAMTEADLQKLTDEFYASLQRKLSALGISFADWQAIQATEYYKKRQTETDRNKRTDTDAKNGQAWVSFTAFDGPVFNRFNPASGFTDELLAFGRVKNFAKMAETLGADVLMLDAVVDFTSVNMQTNIGTVYEKDGVYTEYTADGEVAELMSVPQSWALFMNQKNGFDQYKSQLPVAVRGSFTNRIYEDANKAALKTRTYFGDTSFTFVPRVIEVDRERYLAAARRALELYADLFVEKMRQIRLGVKPSDSNRQTAAVRNPEDNKTVADIREQARRNNDTSPVTFNENMDAARRAASERQWNLAAGYYGEAIKLQPDDFNPYFQRGAIYINELKNYKAAVADFTKALELNPNEHASYYNRGTAYIHTSDWKKAIKDFDAVLKIQPTHVESYLNRGIAYLNLNKTDEAMANFNRGLQLNPRLPNLYRARSVAYKVKGNNAEAQADELRAAQLERGQ